jgi:hypothetical protein
MVKKLIFASKGGSLPDRRLMPVGSRNSSWLPSNPKRLVVAASLGFPTPSNFLTIGEAATIVHSELGLGLSQREIHKLIAKSRITNLV